MAPAWMGGGPSIAFKSIRLALVRAHVAAGGFPSRRTWLAALIGRQKVPCEVTAATGAARIKRRAAFPERHGLRGTSVTMEPAELGTLPIEIP